MNDVHVESVGFRYEGSHKPILRSVDLSVSSGELLCVLGRSGSGKSTLLHLIAGLLQPTSGDISIDEQSVLGVPAHKRQVILLSQKALLFPFTTVAGNVEFSPRLRGQSRSRRQQRVAELLELVGLSGFEPRTPASLSGGEAQRVALARALAADPTVILMDEPFSNLDAPIRTALQGTFRELHERHNLTTIFVTHQLDEAMALGDRVAGLVDGTLDMVATSTEVYLRPTTSGMAQLVGVEHWLEGRWNGSTLSGPWGSIEIEGSPPAATARAAARPEHLSIVPSGASANPLRGKIVDTRYRGSHFDVTVELDGGSRLKAHKDLVGDVPAIGDLVEIDAKSGSWFALRHS